VTVKPAQGVITPVFIYSNLTVHQKLTTATLGKVQTDNSANAGTDFGVNAHLLGTLAYLNALGTKVTVNTANPPPKTDQDFLVSLI